MEPTLTTSTGKADPTSPYGAGFSNVTNLFTSLAGTAGSTFAALKQTEAEKAKANAASKTATAQTAKSSSLGTIAIIGGAVVVLLIVVMLFKRK